MISDMQPTSGIVTHMLRTNVLEADYINGFFFLLDKLSISQALIQPYKAVIVRLAP